MRLKRFGSAVSAFVVSASTLLNVAFVPITSAAADTCTWTGGGSDDNFSTAANWSGCDNGAIPESGDTLVFDRTSLTATTTVNNDMTGLSLAGLTFSGTNSNSYDFTVTGNALTLTGDVTLTNYPYATLDLDVTAGADIAVNGGGGIYFGKYQTKNTHTTSLGSHSLAVSSGVNVYAYNKLTGTGAINTSGYLSIFGDADGYSGTITSAASGSVAVQGKMPTGQIAVGGSGSLYLQGCDGSTIPANLAFSGTNPQYSAKLTLSSTPCPPPTGGGSGSGGGGGESVTYDEYLGSSSVPTTGAITLGGTITLNSDITVQSYVKTATVTSAITGAHTIKLKDGGSGSLVLQSTSNGSATPNGTYNATPEKSTISDDQSAKAFDVYGYYVLTVDGKIGRTRIEDGATLKGTGTVGQLQIDNGATIAPGHSPGILNTGNLTLNGAYEFEIAGPTAGTEYDQIKVTGTVALDPATAELKTVILPGYKATAGQKYVIIDNDGTDAVTGTFKGLAQGATFTVGTGQFRISYTGGDGNDVELTVIKVPGSPDTGFMMLTANPALTLAVTVLGAGALLFAARRVRA